MSLISGIKSWKSIVCPYTTSRLPEALSVAEPNKWKHVFECLGPFADLIQAWYWWQSASIYSVTPLMCIQAQYRQLPTIVHFIAVKRKPRVSNGQCIDIKLHWASPKSFQNQHNLVAGFTPYQSMTIQQEVSTGTRPCWTRFCFVGSAPAQ